MPTRSDLIGCPDFRANLRRERQTTDKATPGTFTVTLRAKVSFGGQNLQTEVPVKVTVEEVGFAVRTEALGCREATSG